MSYIQLVSSPDALIREEWTVNPRKAYYDLEERDQCGYLLQHALFLNVLKSIYRVVPTLLKGYVKEMTEMVSQYIRFVDGSPDVSSDTKLCSLYMEIGRAHV